MKRGALLTIVGLSLGLLAAMSCRRTDVRMALVDVPRMTDELQVRIVTNAALNEVVGRYDGIKHDYEIDMAKGIVRYHESRRLMSGEYRARIVARIKEVGFDAKVVEAGPNPFGPVMTRDGPIDMWPTRHTAVITVSGMKTHTHANIVVDAIAYARVGRDDPRICIQRAERRVLATYESMRLSLRNLEQAIACVGFDANAVPANLGRPDAIPYGWTPVN